MQRQDITSIYESAVKLMQPLSVDATYELIAQEAKRLTSAQYTSIFLVSDGVLKRVFSTVPQDSQVEPRQNGNTYQVFRSGKARIITGREFLKVHPEFKEPNLQHLGLIPLSNDGETIGVLSCHLYHKQRFTPHKLQILQLFGSLASLKIKNNALVNDLKTAVSTRDLFISMASHELKTPLTTISAYVQMIDKSLQSGKEIKPKWTETLNFATQRLINLINELLHVSQIKTGKLTFTFETVDIKKDVINRAMDDFLVAHPDALLQLSESTSDASPIMVEGDGEKLLQVLTNVLNNAAKFTPQGQPISLGVSCDNDFVNICVKDRGPGIDAKDLEHIFEEFYKAKDNNRPGMGLGLFISKRIVEAHRGHIELVSAPGQGTEVKVFLPLQKS